VVKIIPADGFGRVRKRRAGFDGRFQFRSVTPSGLIKVRANRAGVGHGEAILEMTADSLIFDLPVSLR
jgi:hypothetical protein